MSYEAYIKPKKVRRDTRKRDFYDTCATRGERVAVRQNARRKVPNKPGTLRTWASHMKHEGVWKP